MDENDKLKGSPRAGWSLQLEESLQQSTIPGTILATLSTIRDAPGTKVHNRPSARTINIRRFDGENLFFVTDTRSQKVKSPDNFVEVCIWAPQSSKQYRLSGKLHMATSEDNEAMIKEWWDRLSERERTWWRWPHPGHKRADKRAGESELATNTENKLQGPKDAGEEVPECFCVCVVEADYVDVLDVGDVTFPRMIFTRDDFADGTIGTGTKSCNWSSQSVNA